MSELHRNDHALRSAFQALSDSSVSDCSQADLDRIWRAVDGELPADERRHCSTANRASAPTSRVSTEPLTPRASSVLLVLAPDTFDRSLNTNEAEPRTCERGVLPFLALAPACSACPGWVRSCRRCRRQRRRERRSLRTGIRAERGELKRVARSLKAARTKSRAK